MKNNSPRKIFYSNKHFEISKKNINNNPEDFVNLNMTNFHKQDPYKFLVLPKRRPDTNTVFSLGLKNAMSQENNILANFSNENYFKLDYGMIKNILVNHPNFNEKLNKRILLNKNLKKSFATIEKPFPLLNKISNCKSINKTDDFLLSIILNHRFDIDEEPLKKLLAQRRNKTFDIYDKEKQKLYFINCFRKIDKNLFVDMNKQENFGDFKITSASKIKKDDNKTNENIPYEYTNEVFTSESNDKNKSFKNHQFNTSELKENKNIKPPKNDFFIVSSNFGVSRSKILRTRTNINQETNYDNILKLEDEIIRSIEYDYQRIKNENLERVNIENKSNTYNAGFVPNKNKLNNNLNNSNININSKNNISKSKNNSQNNLFYLNLNEKSQIHRGVATFMDESYMKMSKISLINNNTNTVNLVKTNLSNKIIKDKEDSKMKCAENNSSDFSDYININNFNRYGNKTISTENDFRKFDKNVVNKILSPKKNIPASEKKYKKPNFMKYKYPIEKNKTKDIMLENIKNYLNRKNKSSQIKSRIFGPQDDSNNCSERILQSDLLNKNNIEFTNNLNSTSRENFNTSLNNTNIIFNNDKKNKKDSGILNKFTKTDNFEIKKKYNNHINPINLKNNNIINKNSILSFNNKSSNFFFKNKFIKSLINE